MLVVNFEKAQNISYYNSYLTFLDAIQISVKEKWLKACPLYHKCRVTIVMQYIHT